MPSGIRVFYQKQMSHHLLPHMGREWLDSVTHAFLIRDPLPMLASLGEKLANFDLLATGLPQQVEIFEHVILRTGKVPAVLDAADLLERPEPLLRALCDALGVPFTERMLWWPAGRRDVGRHLGPALVRPRRAVDGFRDIASAIRRGCRGQAAAACRCGDRGTVSSALREAARAPAARLR